MSGQDRFQELLIGLIEGIQFGAVDVEYGHQLSRRIEDGHHNFGAGIGIAGDMVAALVEGMGVGNELGAPFPGCPATDTLGKVDMQAPQGPLVGTHRQSPFTTHQVETHPVVIGQKGFEQAVDGRHLKDNIRLAGKIGVDSLYSRLVGRFFGLGIEPDGRFDEVGHFSGCSHSKGLMVKAQSCERFAKLMKNLPMSFRWRWILNCAAGEFFGIALAAAIAVAGNQMVGEPSLWWQKLIVLILALLSGLLEGSILAWFQWRVMRKKIPSLPLRRWWRNTVLIALAGWFLGMLPSLLLAGTEPEAAGASFDPAWWVILITAGSMGLLLGALFGWAQWLELKKHLARAASWVGLNALGWLFGMIFIFIAATWPDTTTPVPYIILSGMVGGLLAGLSVGIATSFFFDRLGDR